MEDNFFEMILAEKEKKEMAVLMACNEKTETFGLSLTEQEAQELVVCRNESLKKYRRVEFGNGILDKLIFTFCDSQYINQENYKETMEKLQDIFYCFKNEAEDQLTDDELLSFMREQFEEICMGDTEYLESTCLPRFAAAIRAGYRGYQESGGNGEYENLSQEARWDKDLYMDVVKELFWCLRSCVWSRQAGLEGGASRRLFDTVSQEVLRNAGYRYGK